jgi:hypothetical protein
MSRKKYRPLSAGQDLSRADGQLSAGLQEHHTPRCMPGSPLARARSCTGSWDPTDMCVLTVWISGRQKVRQATKE